MAQREYPNIHVDDYLVLNQGLDAIDSWVMTAVANNEPLPSPGDYIAA